MGVLATLALFAWMALMMLFLLGKFQPGVRTAAAEPVKGGKESVEEWTKRYLAWRAQRKRQLIKTSILLDPETDLEDVSPPLNEHQSLHRAVVLEAAIWGYVKSLTLVDHVLECDDAGGEVLRKRCLENEWVHSPDEKKPDPPPQTTNATIEKLRAQCMEMGLSSANLVAVSAKVLETVLDRYGAQCIDCRKWRLRDQVTIEQYEETADDAVVKRFGVARCLDGFCGASLPPMQIVSGHNLVNKARAEVGIEQMDQVVIKTGGTPQVVFGPAEVVIKHSTVKKVLDQMRMPELAPGMHPDDCTCFGCFREPLDDAIRNNG